MKIITTNETLTALIPNVVATVEGEQPLIDKIDPWLTAAEDWVMETFTGLSEMESIAEDPASTVWEHMAQLTVTEALRRAIPSLDIVLTPNGFGIVSNQNVAPASKDRIERLINQMASQRDHFINMLLNDLCRSTAWTESQQYAWFASSLIQFPKVCVGAVYDRIREGQQWDLFLQMRERAITIEDAIAEKWISYDVMTQLRTEMLAISNPNNEVFQVARKVRACVYNELRGNSRNHWDLDRIVNYIRIHPDLFPAWEGSDTAKLYNNPPVFKNKKNSSGYFF